MIPHIAVGVSQPCRYGVNDGPYQEVGYFGKGEQKGSFGHHLAPDVNVISRAPQRAGRKKFPAAHALFNMGFGPLPFLAIILGHRLMRKSDVFFQNQTTDRKSVV